MDVYNRALSGSEIAAMYNAGLIGKCRGNPLLAAGSPNAGELRISHVQLINVEQGLTPDQRQGAATGQWQIALNWSNDAARHFIVESSTNLTEWTQAPAQIIEVRPGLYEAKIPGNTPNSCYFRLRRPQ